MPAEVNALRHSHVRTDDWPAQAADAIVSTVGVAHDKITGPVLTLARAVVYGLLAAVLGGIVSVLGVILLLRITNVYLPDSVFGEEHMWAAHLIVGLLLSAAGLFLFRKARAPRQPAS